MTTTGPFRSRSTVRRMVLVGVAGLIAGVGMFVLILVVAGSGDVEVKLGDDEFRAGRVDSLADAIDRDGPLAFSDVAFRGRPIYVHHVGERLDSGWIAVEARAPGQAQECILQWQEDEQAFADPCSEETYPPDSARLVHLPTRVDDELLYVDLRADPTE